MKLPATADELRADYRAPDPAPNQEPPTHPERIIELLTQIRDLLQARKPGRKPKK